MVSRISLILFSTCLAFSLSSCATSDTKVDPAITSALSGRGVSGSTYTKVANAKSLDFNDILTLVQKGVPAHIVESYLQSTQKTYRFTANQMNSLRSAGAAPQLLNYLSETGGFYARPPAPGMPATGPRAQYTHSRLYQDEQPFAYNAPEIDSWYNSAYEESLYSPFSFDGD